MGVWAWGDNDDRQLGVQVVGSAGTGHLKHVVGVTGGADYSVALCDDETVWASRPDAYLTASPGSRRRAAVAAGGGFSLAVWADRSA